MSQVLHRAPGTEEASARSAPVVEAEHLQRRFGGRLILADVTFSVAAGEAFGIAGSNGSGKSVLLRLLASLDRPTGGAATILGHDTAREAPAVRRAIGYVSEQPMLYDGITAEQFLNFVGRTRGLGRQVRTVATDTLLQVVGLEGRRHREISFFSPGERRRLALAGALVHEPPVLLLDDPLRGLDGYARLEQIEVLRELRRMGNTLVMSGTRAEDLLDICTEIGVLRDGRIAWHGTEQEALQVSSPDQAERRRVRLDVLDGREAAITLLGQRRDVQELEADEETPSLWFLFEGDQSALAALVPQLVRAGCTVTHFGVERRSAAHAIAAMFGDGT